MAALELAGKLAILDAALQRLESELERDENWRALRADPPAGMEADRAHRDSRLRQALEANPVYRAWKDVGEAARVLRAADARPRPETPAPEQTSPPDAAARAAPPSHGSLADALQQLGGTKNVANTAENGADREGQASPDPYELPAEIANLIATHFEQHSLTVGPGDPDAAEVGERATHAVERALAIPTVAPVDTAQIERARQHGLEFQRRPSLQDRVAAALPETAEDQAAGHSVPLEAEDLAFLLRPASRPPQPPTGPPTGPREQGPAPAAGDGVTPPGPPAQSAHQAAATQAGPPADPQPPPAPAPAVTQAAAAPPAAKPLRDRLLAEAQSIPARASILGAGKAGKPKADVGPPGARAGEDQRFQRLSRLIKGWSRR